MPDKDLCGTCTHFNKDNIVADKWLGSIHVCDKSHICEPWNLHDGCEDYVLNVGELKPVHFVEIKILQLKKYHIMQEWMEVMITG